MFLIQKRDQFPLFYLLCKNYYQSLLRPARGFLDYKYILKCRDNDSDGWDDVYPEREALSFGNSSDLLYDTDIVLWFKIHENNISSSTETQAHISWEGREVKTSDSNNIISYILVIKREERESFFIV